MSLYLCVFLCVYVNSVTMEEEFIKAVEYYDSIADPIEEDTKSVITEAQRVQVRLEVYNRMKAQVPTSEFDAKLQRTTLARYDDSKETKHRKYRIGRQRSHHSKLIEALPYMHDFECGLQETEPTDAFTILNQAPLLSCVRLNIKDRDACPMLQLVYGERTQIVTRTACPVLSISCTDNNMDWRCRIKKLILNWTGHVKITTKEIGIVMATIDKAFPYLQELHLPIRIIKDTGWSFGYGHELWLPCGRERWSGHRNVPADIRTKKESGILDLIIGKINNGDTLEHTGHRMTTHSIVMSVRVKPHALSDIAPLIDPYIIHALIAIVHSYM